MMAFLNQKRIEASPGVIPEEWSEEGSEIRILYKEWMMKAVKTMKKEKSNQERNSKMTMMMTTTATSDDH